MHTIAFSAQVKRHSPNAGCLAPCSEASGYLNLWCVAVSWPFFTLSPSEYCEYCTYGMAGQLQQAEEIYRVQSGMDLHMYWSQLCDWVRPAQWKGIGSFFHALTYSLARMKMRGGGRRRKHSTRLALLQACFSVSLRDSKMFIEWLMSLLIQCTQQ